MNQKNKDVMKLISKVNYYKKDEIFDSNNNVNIHKIIHEALDVNNTIKSPPNQNNILKRDELLEKTRENSIINFLNDLQNKNIRHIKNSFLSKIKETSANTQILIDNSKNQTKQYNSKYNNVLEEY